MEGSSYRKWETFGGVGATSMSITSTTAVSGIRKLPPCCLIMHPMLNSISARSDLCSCIMIAAPVNSRIENSKSHHIIQSNCVEE